MNDEQIRQEKYRCVFKGVDGITIRDLFFKSTNSIYNRRVVLHEGEYLLTELLDFEDLKKSRSTGALSKFIEMKWVVVENLAARTSPKEQVETPASCEKELVAASGPSVSIGYPADVQPKLVEVLSSEQSRKPNSLAISEVDAASLALASTITLEKFNSLRYFQKLKAIKETTDIRLLELIATHSTYPQLVHNSKNRIRALVKSK